MPAAIRVLVVDPGPRLARRLLRVLPKRGTVAVVGRVDDEVLAAQAIAENLADLIVVDVDRGDGRGEEVVRAIVAASGAGRVLAASERGGPEVAVDVLMAGACGLLPSSAADPLADVFRRALAGELILPADDLSLLVDRLAASGAVDPGADAMASLTARERDILRTFAAGASTADVAEAFGITPLTVQSHVKKILAKLGVHSKVEAVRLAWRHGLAVASPAASRPG